ncbi:MAG: Ig-like domain-containing protein [Lachnospiraceae bacterium]|nr:Ig-like domain-containing protein [Lachnospiraceae bacterium]
MRDRKRKGMFTKRAISGVMALVMVLSAPAVWQETITAYGAGGNTDQITVTVDEDSPYVATQIKNGNFEEIPWQNYVHGGNSYMSYAGMNSSINSAIEYSIPNDIGGGWNTTEIKPYKGNLFEVWPSNNPLDSKEDKNRFTQNGAQFIEMNTTNPACLYQDLATQGGDVIKWTLQHAARNNLGFQEQRMYVTIGAPERRENGEIIAATGVGVVDEANNTIDDQIDTKIQNNGKAEYRYSDGSFVALGSTAYANPDELTGLSVMKTDKNWHNVAGIYIVPEGQDVTRFAFCADATSKKDGDVAKDLSGGNFLDNITFSTLIGSITATKQADGDVDIKGYWGDEDTDKKLIVKIGSEEHEIDMTGVSKKNFVINVPESIIEAAGASDVEVYHEDYRTATTTVAIKHEHEWNYAAGNSGNSGKLYAYCSNTVEPLCSWNGAEHKLALTLTAPDATYTGEPYTGASINNDEKLVWEAAGLPVPKIMYAGTDSTAYGPAETAPTDEGSYEASITVDDKTTKVPFNISRKDIAGSDITVTIDPQNYTHDGVEKEPSIIVKDGETTLVSGTDYTISGAETGSTVGEYVITVTGAGKYKGTVHKTWEIIPADITNFEKYEYSGIYDGNPHCSTVSAIVSEGAEITYSTSEEGDYGVNPPEFTEVGTYTVYYKIAKDTDTLLSGTLTVTIIAKPQYQIILENDGNGTASAAVAGATVTSTEGGNQVTLTATPNSGYQLKQWSVLAGDIILTGNQFTMPDTSVTIKAEFEVIQGGGNESGGGNQPDPGSSSGSGGTPTTPSEPVAPIENFEIPVKNENTVKVEAEIKSGTANVSEITTKTIENVVNSKDAQSKVDTITIDLSGAKQEVTGVTLSKESVKTLAETTAQKDNGIETATIELSKATVELDQKTLATLVEQAKGEQIELVVADKDQKKLNSAQQTSLSQCQVANTFEAYFTSGGQRIHDFKGGKAVVSIDFTPEAGKDTSFYHLVYVADNGEMTRYKTKYEKRKLMFTTTHFSDYAVIYDITEKNETDEQQEEEKGETEADSSDTDRSVTMDTTYAKLRLRVPKSTKTANMLKWNKVADADGYVIYGNLCNTKGKTYQQKVLVTIKDNATTAWIDKNLATGVYYKYSIKAYKLIDGKKVWIAKSKVVHSTTAGGKYGNATSVKVNKTAVTLEVGKTFTIKAEQIVKDLPIKKHVVIKYESSNSKVASVTGKGVIKAKKKGSCYIYVYAQNGMYQRVKVTVK